MAAARHHQRHRVAKPLAWLLSRSAVAAARGWDAHHGLLRSQGHLARPQNQSAPVGGRSGHSFRHGRRGHAVARSLHRKRCLRRRSARGHAPRWDAHRHANGSNAHRQRHADADGANAADAGGCHDADAAGSHGADADGRHDAHGADGSAYGRHDAHGTAGGCGGGAGRTGDALLPGRHLGSGARDQGGRESSKGQCQGIRLLRRAYGTVH
mmetsp:Transcript_19221/g.52818  ORF Transcript_19221/g.52818 Transcript_19221/m.52818 type:complete len:211 (-) Transcript_19221:22-654(-)